MLTHSHSDGEFPVYSQGEVIWCVDVVMCAKGITEVDFCRVVFLFIGVGLLRFWYIRKLLIYCGMANGNSC